MLSAIREIGKWQKEKLDKDELDVLVKKPNFKIGGKIVFIKVNIDEKMFEGVEIEDYDPAKFLKYLFRGGVSQGPNPTPITNILNAKKGKNEEETKNNLKTQTKKTFGGKIQKWFDKHSINTLLSNKDKNFLCDIRDMLSNNQDQIIQAIQVCIADIPKKEGKLLTVKIKEGSEWKYIGDFEIFKKSLKDIETEKVTGISANDKNCSVCGIEKELVSGDASVFKFYTIDKPGFITGGFIESLAWKNFPVCSECKLELEEGRRFVEDNLTYRFYGLRYLLIPKLLLRDVNVEVMNILLDPNKSISLKERVKKRITDNEEEILDVLANEKDVLTLSFLFLSKEQSAERILLLIEDVFPSRIRRIFKAKDAVDDISGDSFTFGKIRDFFAKSDDNKRDYDLNKYFLEIVDKVFRGITIDFSFLMKFFMAKIRKEFITEGYFNQIVKSAIMSLLFFENLGLITFKEVKDMEAGIFSSVFTRYGKSLATPEKRGIFLMGALTQLLLNKQWSDRNAKPFMKKLKGLKMDEKDIKALLPEVQSKLEEYDSFDKGKKLIASEASKYILEAGDEWRMPVDEINFYFVCGMNLVDNIASIIYPKEINKQEE